MGHVPQKQGDDKAFAQAVDVQYLTVDYWHERFKEAITRFNGFVEMADLLAGADDYYKGAAGVLLLQRVQAGRAKLGDMAKAVQLMETLRPEENDLHLVLKRQKLVAPER